MKAKNRSNPIQFVASRFAQAACCLAAALALTGSTTLEAAITGQWDFKSGDLSATMGLPLEYFDYPGGDTDQQTVFGTTTALGLPDIGGAPAHVMGFPKSLPHMGYVIYPNMHSNGGGSFVNQYTLIFDLLYPTASAAAWRALIQINDPYNTDDADLFINPTGGIGISAQYHGVVQANTWHRIAFAFDLAAPGGPTLSKYIDGVLVNQQILGAGVDGRWALNPVDGIFAPMALLFTDNNADGADNQAGYVSSIQVHDETLSSAYIQTLGAPTTDGIPTTVVVPGSIVSRKPLEGAMNVVPASGIEVVLADGSTPLNTSSIVLKVNNQTLARNVSSAEGKHTVTAALPTLSPRSTNTVSVGFTDPSAGPVTLEWGFRMAAYLLDAELEQVFTNRLAAYWPMDEGLTNAAATLLVDVAGENHSTITTGGMTDYWLDASGSRFGGALHVDGENVYVMVLPSPSLDIGANAMSMALWVKLEQLPSQLPGSYGSIYDSATDEYVIYTDKGNGELRFKVTLANGEAARPGIPEAQLKVGEWMHIAAVYDGKANSTNGEARIYLNGELMDKHVGHDGAPGTGLTGNVRGGQTAAIGRPGTATGNNYVGAIDDLAIWSQALSIDAIGYLSSGHSIPAAAQDPDPLTIVQHPEDKSGVVGSRVMFEVVRSGGTPPVLYQWKHNGVDIPGATSAKLFVVVEPDAAGAYTVTVQDAVRSLVSNPATLTVVTLPGDPAESLRVGLTAHWRLDDGLGDPNTQVLADARGGSPGNLFGGSAAAWLAEPEARFGGALLVDGQTVYATIPNNSILDINENQVSVSLWARLEQLPTDLPGGFGGIFDSPNDSYVVYLDKGNQELRFKVTTAEGQAVRPGIPQSELVLNEWIHVLAVYDGNASPDGGEARIYLNGVVMDTEGSASLTGLVRPGQVTGLGRDGETAGYFYNGAIDDIGVWSRALTADEIAYLSSGHAIPAGPEPLEISGARIESGQIVIQWTGGEGPYQLQRRTSLTTGNWENVGQPTAGTSALDATDAPVRFYRVIKAQ
ncbi:MAG TPA: hypothetical protein P5534_03210 [Candidatus Paceibacterota bacterium]|nr:hypothetical protein [Candidatus Paceibacterota bacterium]